MPIKLIQQYYWGKLGRVNICILEHFLEQIMKVQGELGHVWAKYDMLWGKLGHV